MKCGEIQTNTDFTYLCVKHFRSKYFQNLISCALQSLYAYVLAPNHFSMYHMGEGVALIKWIFFWVIQRTIYKQLLHIIRKVFSTLYHIFIRILDIYICYGNVNLPWQKLNAVVRQQLLQAELLFT